MSKESCLWLNQYDKTNIFLGLIEYELNSLLGASHYMSVQIQFNLERYLLISQLSESCRLRGQLKVPLLIVQKF